MRSPEAIHRCTVLSETPKWSATPRIVQNALVLGFDLRAMVTAHVGLVVESDDREALQSRSLGDDGCRISVCARN